MGGRTKPNGQVDYTNLDHNDANKLPGATLTPQNPLTGLNRLARQVKASGVRRVSGDVVVDDRLFKTFRLENLPVTPIVINNNLIDLTSTPTKPGKRASVVMRPKVRPWKVTTRVKTVAAGKPTGIAVSSPLSWPDLADRTDRGRQRPGSERIRLPRPGALRPHRVHRGAAACWRPGRRQTVAANPVRRFASQRAVTAFPTVARLRSLPLAQEATYVLKVSYNRGAQTMICRLAVAAGSTDCDDGMAKAARIWRQAGLDTAGAVLHDGSGLTGNLITGDNQVDLQTIMARRPDAAAWRSTLPIMGVDGSLAFVQPGGPATGKIFAKTGTLGAADLFNDNRVNFPTKALGATWRPRAADASPSRSW